MPFVYARFCGILGLFRVLLANVISIFRPMMLEVSEGDVRVVVHKSCALAAQTFMMLWRTKDMIPVPWKAWIADGSKGCLSCLMVLK